MNGILSPKIGTLFNKGARNLIIPVTVLLVVATLIYSNISSSTSVGRFVLVYMALMLSIAAIMMQSQTDAFNQLPPHLYAHGTAVANTLQPMSGILGASIFVSIMTQSLIRFLE